MKALKIDPIAKAVTACDVKATNQLFDILSGGALNADNDILYNLEGAVADGKFRLGDLEVYGVAYVVGRDNTDTNLKLDSFIPLVEFPFTEPRRVQA